MSVSPRRVWLFRRMDVLVASALLVSGACHHAQAPSLRPNAEPSGQPSQSKDEGAVRHFPGVDIVPTARSGFLIRLHSGMVGPGEPLYVIDGAPMKISATRGIDWFRPEDIAEIKVLKYPYELAEFGANGANGVIVITTKQVPGRPRRR
jgi:TonB-dependent SusC/RagA subfamily outer membrane receptor